MYADEGGMPSGIPGDGKEAFKVDVNTGDAAYTLTALESGYYLFTINVAEALGDSQALEAGTYWVVFAPKTNLTQYTGTTRWNWTTGTVNENPALLIDPYNAFQAGYTTWTSISAITGTAEFDGLAFTVEGAAGLAVQNVNKIKDVIATFDKATGNVYLFLNNKKFQSAEVYSVDGRRVLTSNNTVFSTSTLKSGVYVVKVQAQDGTVKTTKFIK